MIALRASAPIFVFFGQSNAETHGLTTNDLPANLTVKDAGIQIWDDGAWATLENGVNNQGSHTGSMWGPEAEFARRHRLDSDETVYIVKKVLDGGSGDGKSSLTQHVSGVDWHPESTGDLFDQTGSLVTAAKAALASSAYGRVRAVCMMQGETDSLVEGFAAAYADNLAAFEAAMRVKWGDAATKFIIGRISDIERWTYGAAVRVAQSAAAAANPRLTAVVDTDGYTFQSDGYHYSATGVVALGADMYAAYRALNSA